MKRLGSRHSTTSTGPFVAGREFELLEVARFELEYAAFNAKRSLGTTAVRPVEVRQTAEGVIIRCPDASDNPYVNRLVSAEHPTSPPEGALRVDRVTQAAAGASLRILAAPTRLAAGASRSRVVRYESDRAAEFLRIVESTSGERLGDDVIAAKSIFYCSEEFRCFVASEDGEIQGIATTFVRDGMGWFANAFTFPVARRKGVHRALLDARLADAQTLGLERVYADVVPGSDSERNLLRAGYHHVAYYVSEAVGAWLVMRASSGDRGGE